MGCFWFYAAVILVLEIGNTSKRVLPVSLIYVVSVLVDLFARAILNWRY